MALFKNTAGVTDPLELLKAFTGKDYGQEAMPKPDRGIFGRPARQATQEVASSDALDAYLRTVLGKSNDYAKQIQEEALRSSEEAALKRMEMGITRSRTEPLKDIKTLIEEEPTLRPVARPEPEQPEQDAIGEALLEVLTEDVGEGLMSKPKEEVEEEPVGRKMEDRVTSVPNLTGKSDNVYSSKGKSYDPDKVKEHSYYNKPLVEEGIRGNSRIYGDASTAVQDASINAIVKAGIEAGMSKNDIALTLAIAKHESGFNPDAAAGTTSAHGLGQFINDTGTRYGLTDENRWDINAQARALVEHTKDNIQLAKKRGKGIEYVYKYHHDGPNGNYGGLGIARKSVIPMLDTFKGMLSDMAPTSSSRPKAR